MSLMTCTYRRTPAPELPEQGFFCASDKIGWCSSAAGHPFVHGAEKRSVAL